MPPSDPNLGKTGASPGWGRLERGPFRRVNPKSLELLRFHSAQKWRGTTAHPFLGPGRRKRAYLAGWGRKRGRGRDVPRPRHAQGPSGGSHPGMHFDLMAGLRNARIQRCHGVGRRRGARSCRTIAVAESRGRGREHGPRETFGRRASCASAPQVDPGAWTVGRGRGVPSGRTVTRRFSGPLRRDGAGASVRHIPAYGLIIRRTRANTS